MFHTIIYQKENVSEEKTIQKLEGIREWTTKGQNHEPKLRHLKSLYHEEKK